MNADSDMGQAAKQSGDSIEGVASKPVAADAHTTHDIRQQGLGGVVEDVEERTDYSPQDSKSVIRVVLRNRLKCVRISFWTDQFRTLGSSTDSE